MAKTIKEHLQDTIKQSLSKIRGQLSEAVPQQAAAPATPPPAANPAPAQPAAQPGQAPATDDSGQKLATAEISTKDIIEKLNAIRAGRSFKDSQVADPMTAYVDGLDGAEKTALYAFLSGISQIVTGTVDGQVATEPKDAPADVEMKKEISPGQEQHVQPRIIGKGGKTVPPKVRPENTASPSPVVPRSR